MIATLSISLRALVAEEMARVGFYHRTGSGQVAENSPIDCIMYVLSGTKEASASLASLLFGRLICLLIAKRSLPVKPFLTGNRGSLSLIQQPLSHALARQMCGGMVERETRNFSSFWLTQPHAASPA